MSLMFGSFTLIVLLIARIAYLYATRQEIRDANGDLYMTRFFLWGGNPHLALKAGKEPKANKKIYLHHFHRSDHDRALHDHPWPFKSLILWGGYREYADMRDIMNYIPSPEWCSWVKTDSMADYQDFKPLSFVSRPAKWRHRVELFPGKKAWTLVFVGKKERTWGFWIDFMNFCQWKKYDTQLGICEDGQ